MMSNAGSQIGIILLLVLPLGGAALCLLEKGIPRLRIARIVALTSAAALAALVFALLPVVLRAGSVEYNLGGFGAPVGIRLNMDGLAWIGTAVCVIVAFPAILFSAGERRGDPYFYTLLLAMVSAMIGVVITDDVFTMFVLFEIVGIAAYVLIAYSGKRTALLAALRYLMLSSVAMLIYLFGVFVLYRETGLLSITGLSEAVGHLDGRTVRLALAALTTGIATRVALMPFHAWLPEAHAAAPHGVSALLSGALVKVSFIAMWRILVIFDVGVYRAVFLWLGTVMALGAVIRALAQSDGKKLLAWHTVSQMGYIVAAFGAGTAGSQGAAIYYIIAHALFKALLFLVVGATLFAGGQRDVYRAGGFIRISPLLFVLFLVGALAISGAPPLNGFAAKKLVLGAFGTGAAGVAGTVLWLTAIGTSASFIKLSAIFWRRPAAAQHSDAGSTPAAAPERGGAPRPAAAPNEQAGRRRPATGSKGDGRRIPLLVYVAAGILALLCVGTGIRPDFWQALIFTLLYGSSWQDVVSVSPVYTLSGIVESIVPIALGTALYFGLQTRPGRLVMTRIKNATISFDGAAILVTFGFVAFGGLALLVP